MDPGPGPGALSTLALGLRQAGSAASLWTRACRGSPRPSAGDLRAPSRLFVEQGGGSQGAFCSAGQQSLQRQY